MCDLKATQMNMECSLIQELMYYKFKQGYNPTEASKNICVKGEGTVNHITVTRGLKKCWTRVARNDQVKSGRPKTMDSETPLQAI